MVAERKPEDKPLDKRAQIITDTTSKYAVEGNKIKFTLSKKQLANKEEKVAILDYRFSLRFE